MENKFGELRSGWAIALCLAMFLLLQVAVGVLLSVLMPLLAQLPAPLAGLFSGLYTANALQIITSLTMLFVPLLLFKLLYKRPLRQMGLVKEKWLPGLLLGCGMGIAAMGLCFVVMLLFGWVTITRVNPGALATPGFWLWMVQFMLVGFGEEILGRGYVMTVLKTTRSRLAIYLVSAAIFSLMHFANPGYGPLPFINIFLVGLLFALLFEASGSVWMPIGYHFTWNFFQGNVFGFQVSGLQVPAVLQVTQEGPALLTGGGFGPEGGLVVTAVTVLCLLLVKFAFKKPLYPAWDISSDLPFTKGQGGFLPPPPPPGAAYGGWQGGYTNQP